MADILGHTNQKMQLEKFLSGRKMHHSFLFAGPQWVGKMTIAHIFAHALVHGHEHMMWATSGGGDSDIIVVTPCVEEKRGKVVYKNISIDQINEARRVFALTPDKIAKVLIIDDADRMTVSAQNALLKTLEEPQERRFIILVAHRPDKLLHTITSRCFAVAFHLVDDVDMACMDEQELTVDAQGRPGLLRLMQNDVVLRELVIDARNQLRALSRMSMGDRMRLAVELSKKDEQALDLFFHTWIYRIRRAAIDTQKYHLLKIAERVENTLYVLRDSNVNKLLTIEDLLIRIA